MIFYKGWVSSMSEIITINLNKKPAYDIVMGNDFNGLAANIKELQPKGDKCLIVTDSNVEPLYLEAVSAELKSVFESVFSYSFKAGEDSKNLETISEIHTYMLENGFNRSDYLIALGGGVVGDVTGFAASIYMRGIDFIQVPTTLLSMVDSSIGGKTGVDFKQYKNVIGAFYMPKLVYMNVNCLTTLTARQYYAGMGEVMKYGLIMDASFYEWILDKMYDIFDQKADTLEELVSYCCKLKQRIVERDPYDTGDRALLNFGHTIGHAIEKYSNFKLYHGECVALGMVAAAFISMKKGKLSNDEFYEIRDMFVPFNLPISIDNMDIDEIVNNIKHDKKATKDGVSFVLLKKVGKAYIDNTVTEEEIRTALNEINFSEEDMKE